jgi:hypothetical protein
LPVDTKLSRLLLGVMVAPDGAGENAVVTAFVNERLITSTVAAIGSPTRLDLDLPDDVVGAVANVRTVVQRRSAQGDCRFEPQGYPAQILGSSVAVLQHAGSHARNFSDLAAAWSRGVNVVLSAAAAEQPAAAFNIVTAVLAGLSPETSPVNVTILDGAHAAPAGAAFIAIGDAPPAGSEPRVRFDRGRVAVVGRAGETILDLGGYSAGAVAQIVQTGQQSGLWIKPLATDKSLPSPRELKFDRGDIAFIDNTGIALVMSSERDKVVRIAYLDQFSLAALGERYRSSIMGALWLCATVAFLFALQRMFRRGRVRGD